MSLRFVLSRVCVFLYSLGPRSGENHSVFTTYVCPRAGANITYITLAHAIMCVHLFIQVHALVDFIQIHMHIQHRNGISLVWNGTASQLPSTEHNLLQLGIIHRHNFLSFIECWSNKRSMILSLYRPCYITVYPNLCSREQPTHLRC